MFNLTGSISRTAYSSINFRLTPSQVFSPIRQWLNQLEVRNVAITHAICRTIPTQCPFERDICLLGRFTVSIPPMCKLNPFYEEVVSLRFRALCHLSDECSEDISRYC